MSYTVKLAANYKEISRDEFEAWLDKSFGKGKWKLKDNRTGVFEVPLSDRVALVISSSIGSDDRVITKGGASMSARMQSRVTGKTLNRKAQGQKYVTRTEKWEANLLQVCKRIQDAYAKAKDFYEALSEIPDQDAYRADYLKMIEGVQGWQNDTFLASLHQRLDGNGILTIKQKAALERIAIEAPSYDVEPSKEEGDEILLNKMRDLYVRARNANDGWLMSFVTDIAKLVKAGRKLSQKQNQVLEKSFLKYGL